MTVLHASALSKRYRAVFALRDCNLLIPDGSVTALIGPNGAGKSTLLHLAAGLRRPTAGSIRVLDGLVPGTSGALEGVGFVAADAPLYRNMSVAGMLQIGRDLNPVWDGRYAVRRIDELGLPLTAKVGALSGGHQAQLALTIALAKRPRLLLLDEPLARLDPLARHQFLGLLMAAVAADGLAVIFSSHVLAELGRICDHLVLLSQGRVQLAGEVDSVLAGHQVLTGPAEQATSLPATLAPIRIAQAGAQVHLLIRTHRGRELVPPGFAAQPAVLEELVLAYDRRFPVHLWRAFLWRGYGPNYPDLAMQAIPLAAALFVGVRLIAPELEDGTASFAWTQGYGKARWALCKLAAAATVLVPAAVVAGLVFGWWYRLYTPATGYFSMHAFALYAPALAGWTLLGLSLGMASAALTRREGRAMALTLAGWIALHHYAVVDSPHSQPGEFWPLQFAQLAILLALSGLFTGGVVVLLQEVPALPGMPRLLRAVPTRSAPDAQALARQLGTSRIMAVPRAAWRQHRTGLLIALTLLGIYAGALAITGLHIHAEPARLRPRYASFATPYLPGGSDDGNYLLPLLLPFVIGAFIGASLTGPDLGQGTARFAWAQGITRARWAAGQLAAVGGVVVVAAAAAGLLFQWWDVPYLASRLADPWFGLYAPVYAGWMAVAVTAAALAGTLARTRTFPTVACLVATLAVAYANAVFLRVHYLRTAVAINRPAPAGSFFVSSYVRYAAALPSAIYGRVLQNFDNAAAWGSIERTLTRYGATDILVYHPASQFWQLQAIESAGLLAIALVLGAATVWVVRRQEA